MHVPEVQDTQDHNSIENTDSDEEPNEETILRTQ